LGIEININKTKTATDKNLVGEYVSRNINNGVDVSRISANICRAVTKNPLDLPELARHLQERGVSTLPIRNLIRLKSASIETEIVRSLYLLTQIYPKRIGMKLLNKAIRNDY
jgi:hypothetical protein